METKKEVKDEELLKQVDGGIKLSDDEINTLGMAAGITGTDSVLPSGAMKRVKGSLV